MPASDHLQPYQLKLFMQAHELMNTPAGDAGGAKTLSEHHVIHDRKLRESKMGFNDEYRPTILGWTPDKDDSSLYESIQKKGVQKPVNLSLFIDDNGDYEPMINDGHHRISAANDINPNMYVPVEYSHFEVK